MNIKKHVSERDIVDINTKFMTKHGNLNNNNTKFNTVQVAENNYTATSTKSKKKKNKTKVIITLCTMQEEHQL